MIGKRTKRNKNDCELIKQSMIVDRLANCLPPANTNYKHGIDTNRFAFAFGHAGLK